MKKRANGTSTVILDAAAYVINDRKGKYGFPTGLYTKIGKVWAALLGLDRNIPAAEVAQMMVALKVCREMTKHDPDNVIDQAGYAEVTAIILEDTEMWEVRE